MPWHVAKSSKCPSSKPWAVINSDTGDTGNRCHADRASAIKQMKAMYANTTEGDREAEIATWEWEGGSISMPVYDP